MKPVSILCLAFMCLTMVFSAPAPISPALLPGAVTVVSSTGALTTTLGATQLVHLAGLTLGAPIILDAIRQG